MSKNAKLNYIVLIVLLVISIVFTLFTMKNAGEVEKAKVIAEQELQKSSEREKKKVGEIKQLKEQIAKAQQEKVALQRKAQQAETKLKDVQAQVSKAQADRDKWKGRIDNIKQERDQLVKKIKDLDSQLAAEKRKMQETASAAPAAGTDKAPEMAKGTAPAKVASGDMSARPSDEAYWAEVLREKAGLEVKITSLQDELSQNQIEMVTLKQENADIKIELETLTHDKEEVDRDILYKEDLINNLSLELARTRNDKKFVGDRVSKLNAENQGLRRQMKQLVSAKASLEKNIVRLAQEKDKVSRNLEETEGLIQGKIDEIWEIKESIDTTFKQNRFSPSPSGEVELPPIVVSSDQPAVSYNQGLEAPGLDGKVISLNEENNFVIVDLGESSGVRLGDLLSVYRDSKYVARLEVIQVRKDIAAADIKDQWSSVRVGDIIR